MAISTVTNRVAYQGDGSSAVFAWPYRVDAPTDLAAYSFNSSVTNGPVIVPQVINTHFTFSGQADPSGNYPSGGFLTFNSSPGPQTVMTIFRSSIVTNDFMIPQFGGIPSTSLVNTTDYITMLIQRAQDLAIRSARVHDGAHMPGFDPTIPINVQQAAGWAVMINSSATGFVLSPIGSTLFTGILPVQYGGTGTGSSFPLGSIVYAGSGGVYSSTQQMYFDTTANTLYIGSGVVASQFIGGNLSVLGSQTLGGSLTVGSNITLSSLTVSRPLRSTTTGEIGVGSTNMATEVSGLLATAQGGTGTATGYRQFGLIYASSATQFSDVPSSTAGFVLIANGSSAPSFQNLSATNVTATKTANYITGATDRYLFLNSSLFTITLERPASAGKEITVKRVVLDSTSLGNRQIIAGSGCLLGLVGSTTLDTYGESLDFAFDGTNWQFKRNIPTQWQQWTPTFAAGLGTVGSSWTEWRRNGPDIEFNIKGYCGTLVTGSSYVVPPPGVTLFNLDTTTQRGVLCAAGYAASLGDRYLFNFRNHNLIYMNASASVLAPGTAATFGNNGSEFSLTGRIRTDNWNGF